MKGLPKWAKIIIRIILLPCALCFHLVPHIIAIIVNLYRWVINGGEFISYTNNDIPSMAHIFQELKKQNQQ